MDVRIYDIDLSMGEKHGQMEFVKFLDLEMYKDLDFGGFIVIDGKTYKHAMYYRELDLLCVKPVELNEAPEELRYESDFKCPYCGYVDYDAWELSDSDDETDCSSCGSELEFEKVITVEYNIKPKKCAPVTRV